MEGNSAGTHLKASLHLACHRETGEVCCLPPQPFTCSAQLTPLPQGGLDRSAQGTADASTSLCPEHTAPGWGIADTASSYGKGAAVMEELVFLTPAPVLRDCMGPTTRSSVQSPRASVSCFLKQFFIKLSFVGGNDLYTKHRDSKRTARWILMNEHPCRIIAPSRVHHPLPLQEPLVWGLIPPSVKGKGLGSVCERAGLK